MKEKTFTKEEQTRRAQIAATALGIIEAIENGVIDTDTAESLLFRPGIFEKYKDDPELYRLLNLGEELCWTVWDDLPDFREQSLQEIKTLGNKILKEGKQRINMERYLNIISHMKKKGIEFSRGLSGEEIEKIENVYDFKFPAELAEFYTCGLPKGEQFPIWNDFSEENVRAITDRMAFPINALRGDVEDWFWLDKWGDDPDTKEEALAIFDEIAARSPKMIPIFGHRYMPAFDGAPVISTVGRDTIYYGRDLAEYLQHEFLNIKLSPCKKKIKRIILWSDVIEGH